MSDIGPVLPLTHEMAMLDASQSRAFEQHANADLPPHTLMRRAGESIARLALAVAPNAQRFWVAAGPGNNGGDGLQAASHLLQWGKQVEVSLVADGMQLPPDAAEALALARAAGARISCAPTPNTLPHFTIDALLGSGLNRVPVEAISECIRAVNAVDTPVLAVDLPSGLYADTGQLSGAVGVIASHTLAMLTLKPGLFTGVGRDHAGAVWLATLQIDGNGIAVPRAWLSGRVASVPRLHAQHKGSFGDVAVVGGANGMSGAALLAARAAHAAGAGRVYVSLLNRAASTPRVDPARLELMFRDDWSQGDAQTVARTTVVCGCGGGDAVRAVLPRLLRLAHRLVLDADALNAIARDASLGSMLRDRAVRADATVMTPHPLEAARLLGGTTKEVQDDRLHAAQVLADRFGCVVVLKGSGSVIAAAKRVPRINSTGNASLATAGTGDVLAGWLAGRWSQRTHGDEAELAFITARQAVAEHGAAAEPQLSGALRAGDLIERLYAR